MKTKEDIKELDYYMYQFTDGTVAPYEELHLQ